MPTSSRGRISRAEFLQQPTTGGSLAAVVEGLARDHGDDFFNRLGELSTAHRAVAVLEWAVRVTYASGIQAVYDLGFDGAPHEVVQACETVDASAFADVFARMAALVPPDALDDGLILKDWLRQRERQIWDEDPNGRGPLESFDDEFYALEDDGLVLDELVHRYVLANPATFFDDVG